MNNKTHIADTDLTLYAMGSLPQGEEQPIREHLANCVQCREELRQVLVTLAAYAQTTPEVEPPAGARSRFLANVANTPQATAAAVAKTGSNRREVSSSSRQKTAGTAPWAFILAGAFAIALVAVGIDDFDRRAQIGPLQKQAAQGALDADRLSQLMELLTSPEAKRVSLHPGPVTAPPPEGRVVYTARTGKLLLTASNLHPLPAGKTYELWILQPGGKAPLPAGTFAPDASGNASMILANAPADLDVQGFGVTIENAGGSDKPTLPIVLSGL